MNLTGEFYSHQTVEIDRELPAQLRRCVAPRQPWRTYTSAEV